MTDDCPFSPQPQVARTASRVLTQAQVQLRSGTRRSLVKVLDLSTHGARISFAHVMREDDQIFLTLPGLSPLAAHIVWVNGFEAGCRFLTPIHPSVFDNLIGTKG